MQTRIGFSTRPLDLAPQRTGSAERFHRFAPRPLAYSDPRSASVLPPFARARRFLEHVATLDDLQWESLLEHVGEYTDLHESRERHLHSMFVTPARRSARDALVREAELVCEHAAQLARFDAFRTAALSRRVACAALALALRDLLPPDLFELAYGPFSLESVAHGTHHRLCRAL